MGTENGRFRSLRDLKEWCNAAPTGTRIDAATVASLLEDLEGEPAADVPSEGEAEATVELSWREKLWLVPSDTRLGTEELREAIDKPKSFIYARTQSEAEDPIPHRKLGGELQFRAGEVRHWIRSSEEVLVAGPSESTEAEKRGELELMEGAS